MAYEYKIVSGQPSGKRVWEHLEREINDLVKDGWEVVSSSSAPHGNFLNFSALTTFVLRKAKDA